MILRRLRYILLGDTALLRLWVTAIAAMWAALLWIAGDRPGAGIMQLRAVPGGDEVWAAAWTALTGLKLWRLFDSHRRVMADVVTHSFSVLMFTMSVLAIYSSYMPHLFPADLADDVGCVLASIWLLIRTARGGGKEA